MLATGWPSRVRAGANLYAFMRPTKSPRQEGSLGSGSISTSVTLPSAATQNRNW